MKKTQNKNLLIRKVLRDVLERIKPEASVKRGCLKVLASVRTALKKSRLDADAILGGSVAKGTFLKDNYDCDIFVRFDRKKYEGKDISELLKKALSGFKLERIKGSRDYFQFEMQGIHFEIVPVIRISKPEDAVNVIDVSPLHIKWVKNKISKKPKLAEEAMLTRAFCKGIGVYGAESFIRGFSGHVLDILTIHYGGFLKLLKASKKWKEQTVIDPENYHKGMALLNLNASKREGPLVLIDPVQPDRNAAAALSYEKFRTFKKKAQEFLEEPSLSFFFPKKIVLKPSESVLLIEAEPVEGNVDRAGCKLLKALEFIRKGLEQNYFKVEKAELHWEKMGNAIFEFKISNQSIMEAALGRPVLRRGPPAELKKHADEFRKKHGDCYEKDGFVWARIERKYSSFVECAEHLIDKLYLQDKARGFRILNKEKN
ncbi:MAG: nucleotidyltransferase domain-containing protein [Candidatus Woesearchaeota archaeon]